MSTFKCGLPGVSSTLHDEVDSPLRTDLGVITAPEAVEIRIHLSQNPTLQK